MALNKIKVLNLIKRKPSPPDPEEKVQAKITNQIPGSSINFFWSKITFTNEPLWYRITIIMLLTTATVFIIWSLKDWTVPAFLAKKLSSLKLDSLPNIFKHHP